LASSHQYRGIFGQAACKNQPGISQVATVHPDKIIDVFIYAGLGRRGGAYFDVRICVTRSFGDQARLPLTKLKAIATLNPQLRWILAQKYQGKQNATNPSDP
jgi:hypothetical protein